MILLKVSLINKRRLLTSLWQPSLFVFIHYSSFPLRSSLGTISILVHTFQQLTVETHFSPLHQINLFTRQYFLELIKVGLVQPVRSDTGIIYTFHNFLILGFGCFFIFPLSKQLPSLVIYVPFPVLQFKLQWEELGCLLTRQSGFLRYKRFLFGTKLFR